MAGPNPLTIDRGPNGLDITYRWRSGKAFFLLVFACFWNGMLLFFLSMGAGWGISIHLLVGLGLAWYVAAQMLNTTRISVRSGRLMVSHGPVPSLRRSAEVSAHAVRQLRTLKGGSYKPKNGQRVQLFKLTAETDGGEEIVLVRGQRDRELLLQLERVVEDHLGIEDVPVDELPSDTAFNPDHAQWKEMKEHMPTFLRNSVEKLEAREREVQKSTADHSRRQHIEVPRPGPFQPPPSRDEERSLADLPEGSAFRLRDRSYRIERVRQLQWTDPRHPRSRIIHARTDGVAELKQVYAQRDGDDWVYHEERPLDREERAMLEFKPGTEAPLSLRNGDDRYYTGSPLETDDGSTHQFTYSTTRSSTQFRALRHEGGRWEVAVQEPIDDSTFLT
jgi:hypothetical protein